MKQNCLVWPCFKNFSQKQHFERGQYIQYYKIYIDVAHIDQGLIKRPFWEGLKCQEIDSDIKGRNT